MYRMLIFVRRTACVLAGIIVSAQLLPSVALACEGGGTETQKIVIAEVESGKGGVASGTGKCPKEGANVLYAALTEWCEISVTNKNNAEEVELRAIAVNLPKTAECWEKCLAYKLPASGAECAENMTRLRPGKTCWERFEYVTKPNGKAPANYDVITKSENGAPGTAELLQTVKP